MTPNTLGKYWLGIHSATTEPKNPPTTTPGINHFTTKTSTLPSFRWFSADEPDVSMIVANDVASASCITISVEMPA
ncbi:Uncharacterised protein [Vibrio cholerae]|uniref:Uncharacterized protein n=1 Tax=Vibrio cholerae TaxID=666 RepID=A0A656AKE2_VIBCL|nr:Uncharacterised protein [Vibrio cholerae]CSD18761.1 Uncharacterised protein [Vibrio cholerae]CSI56563.1 Uncharacterised protein [Vibrio cholerae]